MAEHNQLYQQALYYDVVFNRDASKEIDFVLGCMRRYAGREAKSALDIACGPGYHARAVARRGLKSVGLDLRPEMLDFARELDAKEGIEGIMWIAADMRDFRLDEPVDVAFCMFDGLDALTENHDLIKHFQAVAENLTPGGLYIVDLSHPNDVSYSHYKKFRYAGERDGVRVEIRWALNDPEYDLVTAVAYTELEMRVNDNGKEIVFPDKAYERLLMPQELTLLAELSGALQPVGWHGDFDLEQPLDKSADSQRMIAVFQRKGQV